MKKEPSKKNTLSEDAAGKKGRESKRSATLLEKNINIRSYLSSWGGRSCRTSYKHGGAL